MIREAVLEVALPSEIENELNDLTEQLLTALSDNLRSLLLYGSLARGSFQPKRSDVNLLLVLNRADQDALKKLAPIFAEVRRKLLVEPFILQFDEIGRVADVFPIRIQDIQRSHRLLAGEELWTTVKLDPEHVRIQLEQSLRNLQIRLRRRLALHGGDVLALRGHLLNLTRPLALDLRHLLGLVDGQPYGEEHTRPIFLEAARKWSLDPQPLMALADLRDGKEVAMPLEKLADQMLGLLGQAIGIVDRFDHGGV